MNELRVIPEIDDDPEPGPSWALNGNGDTRPQMPAWLIDAAELLEQPDPGPTPWVVDGLIVDKAIVACVGRWKTTKSYGLLDVCISIATGEPAFGSLAIPEPGPVVFVNEESGGAALWRRLDALCRGRAINRDRLRGRLYVGANARVKLDDEAWQAALVELGLQLRPRLFVFDPLARMKAPGRDENAQKEMAPVIEFARVLRDETGAGVAFVHHTGHTGETMRGSSDLETAWETKLTWKRDGQSPLVELAAEHREAEAGDPLRYRISWDGETRTMRFPLVETRATASLDERVLEHLREHADQKAEDIARSLQVRTSDVRRSLRGLSEAGTTHEGPSGRRDKAGRRIRDKVWNVSSQAEPGPVPDTGRPRTSHEPGTVACPAVRGLEDPGGTDEPPDDPHGDLEWR